VRRNTLHVTVLLTSPAPGLVAVWNLRDSRRWTRDVESADPKATLRCGLMS
jgi:hypothetical protein